MNLTWSSGIMAGFAATLILTTVLAVCRGQGLTRMDLSLLLGTWFTYDRGKAKAIGFIVHFIVGWLLSIFYILLFMRFPGSILWLGPTIGFLHAIFLLSVGMSLLPSFHPRMANEEDGPEPTRQLEPPGYFALNYGRMTPVSIVLAHALYGTVLSLVAGL